MIERADYLLHEIAKDCREYKLNQEKEYNIFKVLEIENKEVLMCRVLADLLNPKGFHRKGIYYLESFLKEVLQIQNLEDEIWKEIKVYKEYPISYDRRIDIVIKAKNLFIPIEVKVNAEDQYAQCYDYYEYANKICDNAKVIYLTKFGNFPSGYSIKKEENGMINELPKEKINCISFENEIRTWMVHMKEKESGKSDIMKELFRQYIEVIDDFTKRENREMVMKIAERISQSEDNLRAGLEITNSINVAKAKIIYKVMEELETAMEPLLAKYHLEKEEQIRWYSYKETATEKFYMTDTTYPGINYLVKKAKLKNGLSIWFRIEIDHCLFAGFCLFDYKKKTEYGMGGQQDEISEDIKIEVSKYLKEADNNGSWWLLWRYLPTGVDNHKTDFELVPNFKKMNEAAIQLADNEKRKQFIEKAISVIEESLLSLLI